ncbi:hypothetical protein BDD43_2866 [Mucilaginibacter gracilis]|uniref:Addiction module component n=1 Tax=Mucilaginibacter gracilis TaxID=423350 RepID=A0A495J212_9SPHI|nr:hypothetical protein [Mucilaginibacter gracilis]RKR82681.1 hypothetical protein BDD43_2866 [Mucilaginibacter gracilis]
MTATTIRKIVLDYLAHAEDDKIKAIYTLLKDDIGLESDFALTDEQYKILENERELHLAGKTQSYNREQARQLIKG